MFNKNNGLTCPLMRGACVEARCKFWVHLLGHNPQTNTPIDKFDCAIAFLPVLLIENAQQSRQAGAAVESMRNETAVGQERLTQTMQRLVHVAEESQRHPLLPPRSQEIELNPKEKLP